MTTKKVQKRGASRKGDADKTAGVESMTLATTLPPEFFERWGVTPEQMKQFTSYADMFARLVDRPECDKFAVVLEAQFCELYSESAGIRFTRPEVFRVLYPLVMASAGGGLADTYRRVFLVTAERLVPEALLERVRAEAFGDAGEGGAR
jgi:hypothetical protein